MIESVTLRWILLSKNKMQKNVKSNLSIIQNIENSYLRKLTNLNILDIFRVLFLLSNEYFVFFILYSIYC